MLDSDGQNGNRRPPPQRRPQFQQQQQQQQFQPQQQQNFQQPQFQQVCGVVSRSVTYCLVCRLIQHEEITILLDSIFFCPLCCPRPCAAAAIIATWSFSLISLIVFQCVSTSILRNTMQNFNSTSLSSIRQSWFY